MFGYFSFKKKSMSNYLLYENYTLISKHSPKEIGEKLKKHVLPEKTLFNSNITDLANTYIGNITNDTFEISRLSAYKYNFLAPQIKGKFESNTKQTEITVEMRISTWGIIFLCGLFFVISYMDNVSGGALYLNGIPLIYPMYVVAIVIPLLAFRSEVAKSKSFLASLV